MTQDRYETIRGEVRRHYAAAAERGQAGCCPGDGCCGPPAGQHGGITFEDIFSYPQKDLMGLGADALMGLGCGNPVAVASIREGETVLDLGCGSGIDCFLAAKKTGKAGGVIGVDMTPEMVAKARELTRASGFSNIDIRLGEIEHLPVADRSVDVILSNCVINLSPEKEKVFAEAFRVLKPGGRLAIADMVAAEPITQEIRSDLSLHVRCIAGAAFVGDLPSMLAAAGFAQVRIRFRSESGHAAGGCAEGRPSAGAVKPAVVQAVKSQPAAFRG